jgi:hypothetical protein
VTYFSLQFPYKVKLGPIQPTLSNLQLNKMSKFGTSLLVPSVQELAKKNTTEVPEQYLHPNQDPIVVSNTTLQVPVIDLGKLLCEDASELQKLDHACKEWGFFQVSTITPPLNLIIYLYVMKKSDQIIVKQRSAICIYNVKFICH